jgi:hypothetical protein
MGNWKPWTYPASWSLEEHNAVLAALRKAEAELERMGKANNEACARIAELERENAEHRRHVSTVMSREAALKRAIVDIETQLNIVTRDRDHYREEYRPVSAARDAAEFRVRALEAQIAAAHGCPVNVVGSHKDPADYLNIWERDALLKLRYSYCKDSSKPIERDIKVDLALPLEQRPCMACGFDGTEYRVMNGFVPVSSKDTLWNSWADGVGVTGVGAQKIIQTLKFYEALTRVLREAFGSVGENIGSVYRAEARAAYAHIGVGLTHCPNCGDRLHRAECDPQVNEELAKRDAEIEAVIAERDEAIVARDAAVEVEDLLRAERDCLRSDIDNAVKNAMERISDFPWKDKTATEAVWALSLAISGHAAAIDDLRRQLAERTTRPVKVRWSVTLEDLFRAYADHLRSLAVLDVHPTELRFAMDYLLDKTIIDVPPGVPTVDDLQKQWCQYCDDYNTGDNDGSENVASAILSALAPYLRQPLMLPGCEDLAKALHEAYRQSYGSKIVTPWDSTALDAKRARRASADAALAMFRELNPEGGQG